MGSVDGTEVLHILQKNKGALIESGVQKTKNRVANISPISPFSRDALRRKRKLIHRHLHPGRTEPVPNVSNVP